LRPAEARRAAAEASAGDPSIIIPGGGDDAATTVPSTFQLSPAERKARAIATLATLKELSPAAFGAPRPLKIGVRAEIIARAPAITDDELGAALAFHCGNFAYLRGLVEGAERIDLDGAVAGFVTAVEAGFAKERMAKAKAKAEEAKASKPTPAVGRSGRPILTLKRPTENKPATGPASTHSSTVDGQDTRPGATLPPSGRARP